MKVNYCGRKRQNEMITNGWVVKLAEFNETPEQIYNRLIGRGYKQVKVYWDTTMIRGYHEYFAMVK